MPCNCLRCMAQDFQGMKRTLVGVAVTKKSKQRRTRVFSAASFLAFRERPVDEPNRPAGLGLQPGRKEGGRPSMPRLV